MHPFIVASAINRAFNVMQNMPKKSYVFSVFFLFSDKNVTHPHANLIRANMAVKYVYSLL